MVDRIDAARVGMPLGKLWMRSVKSTIPNAGHPGADPARVLSRECRCAATSADGSLPRGRVR